MRTDLIEAMILVYDTAEAQRRWAICKQVDEVAKVLLTDDEYIEFTDGYDKDDDGLIGY